MSALTSFRWVGVLFYLGSVAGVLGQVGTSSEPVSSSPSRQLTSQNLQAFQAEQLALARQEKALTGAGATPQQLQAWHQQNATLFALQRQRAETMAITSALSLRPTNRQPQIPPNASQALKDFIRTQNTLANVRAQIHNQLVRQATVSGQSLTLAQVNTMRSQENQLFQAQNASPLTLQNQRSRTLANTSSFLVRPVPGTVVIPPNASSQMATFLTSRNQIRQGLVQIRNQYANATPAVRAAAMQQWSEQNAALLTQYRQEAQSLSQASTTAQN